VGHDAHTYRAYRPAPEPKEAERKRAPGIRQTRRLNAELHHRLHSAGLQKKPRRSGAKSHQVGRPKKEETQPTTKTTTETAA
jgi:hypothetical protein